MRASFQSVLAATIVLLLTTSGIAQNITKTDFEEFSEMFTGRWIGQVTWVADWPGIGKKGDTATCYLDVSPIEDGNAMIGKFYGGLASGTVLWFYNAGEKRIGGTVVYSNGSVDHLTCTKENGKWIETVSGTLPDGRKTESISTMTLEDDGTILRARGKGTVGGEPTDPRDDKWQRLHK
jgi:hypothetical protein